MLNVTVRGTLIDSGCPSGDEGMSSNGSGCAEKSKEVSSTGEHGWLQKFMYALIAVLGIYILYKSADLIWKNKEARQSVETSALPRAAEDAAARTYAPGYAAAVEGKDGSGWIAGLMKPLVPVYSYLVELQTEEAESESTQTSDAGRNGMQSENVQSNGFETESDAKQAESMRDGENKTEQPRASKAAPGQVSGDLTNQADNAESLENSAEQMQVQGKEEPQGTESSDKENTELQIPGEGNHGLQSERAEDTSGEKESGAVINNGSSDDRDSEVSAENTVEVGGMIGDGLIAQQLGSFDSLLANFYTLDGGTSIDASLLDGERLLAENLSIQKNPQIPQILIYHTHSQESFVDSIEGDEDTSIVGMGEVLAEILRTKYGYQVLHDTGTYDLAGGVLDRSAAYDYAREAVQRILEENPSIEVVIDLHRDGVEGQKFVTEIDGKPCSMIMFFNGLSRDEEGNALTWLDNPNLEENLAFSLQLQVKARQQYPGFTRNIYLKAERFNLHLRPRSLLIEAGTQLNTVEEERNAMEPLANLLNQVLSGQ